MAERKRGTLAFLAVAFLLAVPLSLALTFLLNLRSNRVVQQWPQTEGVKYGSYDPYTLSVVEGSIEWTNLEFPRRHYLFVGRGTDAPAYGHYVDYSFHAGFGDTDAHIRRSEVEWTPEGVTLHRGHRAPPVHPQGGVHRRTMRRPLGRCAPPCGECGSGLGWRAGFCGVSQPLPERPDVVRQTGVLACHPSSPTTLSVRTGQQKL
jgi:hypothetical protein